MKYFLLASLSLSAFAQTFAQTSNKPIYDFASLNYAAEIDPSMNIDGLTDQEYNQLIHRMFELDQKYRRLVMKEHKDANGKITLRMDPKSEYWKFAKVNDKANRTLFLRLLKKYKWPTQPGKAGSSVKAWYIAWHSPIEMKREIYPFMEEAVSKKVLGARTLAPFREGIY